MALTSTLHALAQACSRRLPTCCRAPQASQAAPNEVSATAAGAVPAGVSASAGEVSPVGSSLSATEYSARCLAAIAFFLPVLHAVRNVRSLWRNRLRRSYDTTHKSQSTFRDPLTSCLASLTAEAPKDVGLTKSERRWSRVAVIIWLFGCLLCLPIWAVSLLLRQVGVRMAKGLGARLLHTEQHEGLLLSFGYLHKRRETMEFIPNGVFCGLHFLLTEPVRKCWTDALNVIIIVSGLLTSSSYSAMYSGFGNDFSSNSTTSSATNQAVIGMVQSGFRAANTLSFLASPVTIVVSALLILALQKFATIAAEPTPGGHVLTTWSQALMYFGYTLAVYAFFTSLAAALVAVGLAAYGMFANDYSGWADSVVLWAFLLVSLILIFAGALVTTIDTEAAPRDDPSVSTRSAPRTSRPPSPAVGGSSGNDTMASARAMQQASLGLASTAVASGAAAVAPKPPRAFGPRRGSQRSVASTGSITDLNAHAEAAAASPDPDSGSALCDILRRSSLGLSDRADSGGTTDSQRPLLAYTQSHLKPAAGQAVLAADTEHLRQLRAGFYGTRDSAGSLAGYDRGAATDLGSLQQSSGRGSPQGDSLFPYAQASCVGSATRRPPNLEEGRYSSLTRLVAERQFAMQSSHVRDNPNVAAEPPSDAPALSPAPLSTSPFYSHAVGPDPGMVSPVSTPQRLLAVQESLPEPRSTQSNATARPGGAAEVDARRYSGGCTCPQVGSPRSDTGVDRRQYDSGWVSEASIMNL